jgi:hypothetical protein
MMGAAARLQDTINRGLGQAALRVGQECDVFRPEGPESPLDPERRLVRLACAFSAGMPGFKRQPMPGVPHWYAVLDAAYVQVGDYLCGPQGSFFVASLAPLAPPLVVRCERVLDLMRAEEAVVDGIEGYGGETRCTLRTVLRGWPASVLAVSLTSRGILPMDGQGTMWRVMLPVLPAEPRAADLLVGEDGTRLVVASAEGTAEGWRLIARQAEV